jgi:hypothetical protein
VDNSYGAFSCRSVTMSVSLVARTSNNSSNTLSYDREVMCDAGRNFIALKYEHAFRVWTLSKN